MGGGEGVSRLVLTKRGSWGKPLAGSRSTTKQRSTARRRPTTNRSRSPDRPGADAALASGPAPLLFVFLSAFFLGWKGPSSSGCGGEGVSRKNVCAREGKDCTGEGGLVGRMAVAGMAATTAAVAAAKESAPPPPPISPHRRRLLAVVGERHHGVERQHRHGQRPGTEGPVPQREHL